MERHLADSRQIKNLTAFPGCRYSDEGRLGLVVHLMRKVNAKLFGSVAAQHAGES